MALRQYSRKRYCQPNRTNLGRSYDVKSFGFDDASNEILNAIKHSLSEPKLRTKDLAGSADTQTVGKLLNK